VVQQPSATAQATITLGTQPKVQVADQFSNPVALAGLPIIATANGGPNRSVASIVPNGARVLPSARRLTPTAADVARLSVPTTISKTSSVSDTFPQGLGGKTQVATDATGVATFTDLSLDLPVGSWFLQFFDANESLVSVGTTTIALSPGPIESIVSWRLSGDTTSGSLNRDTTLVLLGATISPTVRVIDKVGNGIADVLITWQAQDIVKELPDGNTSKTDANGFATLTRWVTPAIAGVPAFILQAIPSAPKVENSPLQLWAVLSLQ
jgi:hypothetical protein